MKKVTPASNTIPKQTSNRFAQYPIIGSLAGLFSLNSRLRAAQRALRYSAAKRQESIMASEKAIEDTDALITESIALRK